MENIPEEHTDKLSELLEKVRLSDPMPIFKGAVLCNGNQLVTNQNRFIALFENMQKGEFEYPESMKQKVDKVDIYQGHISQRSDEIYNLFFRLSGGTGVNWTWEQSKTSGYFIGEKYRLDDNEINNFLDEWGDDYEALEFFERCANFLDIEN